MGTDTFPVRLENAVVFNGRTYEQLSSQDDLRRMASDVEVDFHRGRFQDFYKSVDLQKELALLSHRFSSSQAEQVQSSLSLLRQQGALQMADGALVGKDAYHRAALVYYTLQRGASTLGYPGGTAIFKRAITDLHDKLIENPRVLLLGFSTIYSLENLAAMLHVADVKNPTICAFDFNENPLEIAQKYCGNELYGVKIEYRQGNILHRLGIDENIWDMVATHLFFTHIRSYDKSEVICKIQRGLKHGAHFVDEELCVNSNVKPNLLPYFLSLVNSYKGEMSNARRDLMSCMQTFANHDHFYPFESDLDIEQYFRRERFHLDLVWQKSAEILLNNGRVTNGKWYSLRAIK